MTAAGLPTADVIVFVKITFRIRRGKRPEVFRYRQLNFAKILTALLS